MLQSIRHLLAGFHDTTMLLALALWLCVLPFVVLFTQPFFGWQGSLTAVAASFVVALALCYGVCLYPKPSEEADSHVHRSSLR